MIRRAKISEIHHLHSISQACAKKMISMGIFQWNEHYPNKAVFLNDIAREELYVHVLDDKILGAIVLSDHMDAEYMPVNWLTPNLNNFYIHRLFVHPDYWSQGIATKLMDYAENSVRQNNGVSVRLDTFSKNHRNQKFYKNRGYVQLEDIYFPKQSEHPFHCFELILQ